MRFFRRILVLSVLVISAILVIYFYPVKGQPSEIVIPQIIQNENKISFAVISDIHSDYQNLEKVLEKIKNDKIDFVVVAGDLSKVGTLSELKKAKEILDKSALIYYVIPGNHDYYEKTKLTNYFTDVYGVDYQSFQINKVKFILIDNAENVDKVQSKWIDKEIADCPKINCLVFAHMPLNHEYLKHIMGENNDLIKKQAEILLHKFVEFKILKLYTGHIHYLSDYRLEGLETRTDGAVFTNKNTTPSRFVEVTISQPEFKLTEQEVWIE